MYGQGPQPTTLVYNTVGEPDCPLPHTALSFGLFQHRYVVGMKKYLILSHRKHHLEVATLMSGYAKRLNGVTRKTPGGSP